MHLAATYVSHTDNTVHPSCPEIPIPPLTPIHASTSTAAASFPSVDLMQGRTAAAVAVVGSVGDDGYRRRHSIGVGFVQAIIGALCIIFNAVSLAFYDGQQARSFGFVGHGFWIGMMFIVTGTLGLAAGKSRNRCTITGFMTMCIISAMFTLVLLSLGVSGAIAASRGGGYGCVAGSVGKSSSHGFSYHYPHYYRPPCYTFKVVVAMEACMAIAAFFEAIVSIWGAVICCQSRICCYSPRPPTHAAMVLPVTYNPQNGQLMYLTRSQEGLQVVYVPPPSMSYSQGSTGIGPLSYPTGYHVQSAWCRPQQINVASASTGTAIPMNSPPPLPPPYQSYSSEPYRQPMDLQQKY